MDIKKLPKTEFAAAIHQIAGERDIDIQTILDSIELGLISAYKRDQKEKGIVVAEESLFEVELAPESGSFKIFDINDPKKRIDVTPPGFGRIAAQTAKQVIDQKIHEAEKETIVADYQKKVGSLISGIVLKSDPYKLVVGVNKTEAVCPKDEQIRSELIPLGERRLFLLKSIVRDDSGKSELILTRSDPQYIVALFAREVPEVGNQSVVVKEIARSPGVRTKVAVASTQPGLDPVGCCIGPKGSRIQSVLNELPPEEKVDVIQYSNNLAQFIAQALSPAQGVKVEKIIGETVYITVPQNQLALAIGSGGDNVILAGRLTGKEIKVSASTEATIAADQ